MKRKHNYRDVSNDKEYPEPAKTCKKVCTHPSLNVHRGVVSAQAQQWCILCKHRFLSSGCCAGPSVQV